MNKLMVSERNYAELSGSYEQLVLRKEQMKKDLFTRDKKIKRAAARTKKLEEDLKETRQ